MDPISNEMFSHDFQKFVLQDPNVRIINTNVDPPKPFDIKPPEKSSRSKKDVAKQKNQEKKKNLKKPYT